MMNLTARYPAVLALLFLIISAAVSIYFYRNSLLPSFKKYLLVIIKTISIFLILVLFIQPSLLKLSENNGEKTNIILIDNSRSNLLPGENNEPKANSILKILNSGIFKDEQFKLYTFSGIESSKPVNNTDSIKFEGFETNLSGTLSDIKKNVIRDNTGIITVISDGIFNAGGNPLYTARLFQAPVVTIGIGDSIQKKDAVLSSVIYEKRAFTQTDNIIKAVISAYGLQNENLEVQLYREGSLIQSKPVPVKNNSQSEEIAFNIREQNAGIVKYSIKIANMPGELTYLNNSEQFLIEYIDNKTNILLISGGPGYDNAIISDILRRTNNYSLTTRTVKTPNEFYEGQIDYKSFGELSVVFLLGFPISQFSTEITNTISVKAKEFNVPVIFFAQKNTDYKKLEVFNELIPFIVTKPNSGENQFNPRVISESENKFNSFENDINSTPQIFKNVSGIIQKAGSTVLMTDKTSGEPVFISNNSGKRKSSAFLGYGLWKWKLNSRTSYEKVLERFITESVNITLLKDKKTKFKVYPAKDVFDYTENIKLIAEVYDDEYKPVRNAGVTAYIISNGKRISNEIVFSPDDNKYSAIAPPLPYGDYEIESEAELNGNFYGRDKSRFLADSLNTEYLTTKSNFESLRELSANTGGEFFNTNSDISAISEKIKSIIDSQKGKSSIVQKERFNLWENKYILLLIIALLSIEWVIRKRNNIP